MTSVFGWLRGLAGGALVGQQAYEPVAPWEQENKHTANKQLHQLQKVTVVKPASSRMLAKLQVKGMTCAACSSCVEKLVGAMPGVARVSVALLQEAAEVEYDANVCVPQSFVIAIDDAGFDAKLLQTTPLPDSHSGPNNNSLLVSTLQVAGATAVATRDELQQCLLHMAGVIAATVNAGGSVQLVHQPHAPTQAAVLKELENGGFEPTIVSWAQPASADSGSQLQVAELSVKGMTCAACSTAVEKALLALPGVQRACVALTQGRAEVQYDTALVTTDAMLEAVDDAGFDVALCAPKQQQQEGQLSLARLKVGGMTCGACVGSVERCLMAVQGVHTASVNLIAASAEVYYDNSVTGPRHFLSAVEDAGFEASYLLAEADDAANGVHNAAAAAAEEVAYWRHLFLNSLWFTIPVFIVAMIIPRLTPLAGMSSLLILGFPCNQLVKWVLTTPVQFVIGWRFHKGAWKSLRRGTANMDVLVSMGTNASYFYSVIAILHHRLTRHTFTNDYKPTDFFETSAMLISLLLLGKYLESTAKGRTSDALTKLLQLTPDAAMVVELDESGAVVSSQEVPTSLIHKGDLLKVLPGAKVPADGVVEQGASFLNEVMITGESTPVSKGPGAPVTAGTVNVGNALVVRAQRVGSETTLSQIVQLVEKAQMSKAPVQAVADRVSAVFVPVIISLAFLTWMIWYIAGRTDLVPASWLPQGHTPFLFALLFGIAVLVIACPCALGLATPTAVMVGTGVAATQGILIKGADRLEAASKIDVIVFDKTGTLTKGRPSVTQCLLPNNSVVPQATLATLLGSAESESEHPLAHAILEWCQSQSTNSTSTNQIAMKASSDSKLVSKLSAAANPARAVFPKAQGIQVLTGSGLTCLVPAGQSGSQLPLYSSGSSQPGTATSLIATGFGASVLPSPFSSGTITPASMSASNVSSEFQAAPTVPYPLPPSPSPLHMPISTTTSSEPLHSVAVGNEALMQRLAVQIPPEISSQIGSYEDMGHTCVYASVDGMLAAVLCICDPLKPEARGVVAALESRGIRCYMVTGDNQRTANAVARQLGLTSVFAQVLPAGKSDKVRELQAAGRKVAMVGDGINDSPALAASDLGVAIGNGTDIAIEAAHYVLMRDDLSSVLTALDLSRVTLNRIWLNYLWAMLYNILMVPVAAGVLYPAFRVQLPPWVAGFCMACSSVSVVLSSLLLRLYKPPQLPRMLEARHPMSYRGMAMTQFAAGLARGKSAGSSGTDFLDTASLVVVTRKATGGKGRGKGKGGESEVPMLPLSQEPGWSPKKQQHKSVAVVSGVRLGSTRAAAAKAVGWGRKLKSKLTGSTPGSPDGSKLSMQSSTAASSSSKVVDLEAGNSEVDVVEEIDDGEMAMLRLAPRSSRLGAKKYSRDRAERQALLGQLSAKQK